MGYWTSESQNYVKSYTSLSIINELLDKLITETEFGVQQSEDAVNYFKTLVGLFSLGKYDLNDINLFTTNRYFQESLGLNFLASNDILKHEVNKMGPSLVSLTKKLNEKLLSLMNAEKIALGTLEIKDSLDSVKSYKDNSYVGDFLATHEQKELTPTLSAITCFVSNILGLIAHKGLVGELQGKGSLFTSEIKKSLDEKGYALIENVLSEDEAKEVREIIIKLAEWEAKQGCGFFYGGQDKCQRVYNLLNKHEKFRELIQRPLILEIMEHMFNRDSLHDKYVLSSWHTNIIGQGGKASILHVDAAVPEPLPQWIIRANINYMLDDFTVENGATLCLPGSHKFLRKPKSEDQNRSDLVSITGKKGSLAIWDGHLWHKSGANNTTNKRIALLGCFAASHLKEMSLEEDHLQVINPNIVNGMSTKLQKLIGVGHGIKKGALQQPPEML